MSLAPFKIFQIYHGVFLHYSTNYNYQKYLGKTNYTEEKFLRRSDKYSFVKLSKEFAHWDENQFEYYVSWLFYIKPKWVTAKDVDEYQARFQLEWLNYSKYHYDNFGMDMVKIRTINPRKLFEQLQLGDIHYQTILILNKFTGILDFMNVDLGGNPIWDQKYKKLKKFRPFYEEHQPMNEQMYLNFITEKHKCQVY